jgi:hypothetical protein
MINPDYSDMLHALQEEQVEYMLVGGYAFAAHGHPRFTMDIDFWVLASAENAKAIIRALKRFGVPLRDVSEADFATEGNVFQIGVAPHRIDILTKIDGVSFADARPRAILVDWEGFTLPVISIEDLLANKRASGRPKDLADVALLERLLNNTD